MAPNTPSYESILRLFKACRGLYILGAGASAAETPFGSDLLVAPSLDYIRASGSYPATTSRQTELNRRIIRTSSPILMSRLFAESIVSPGDDLLYRELLLRLPTFHARLFIKHELSKFRFLGTQSDSYRIFRFFAPSFILNYNIDGLATDLCGNHHRIVDAHGTIARGYGGPRMAALIEEAREVDVPSTPDDLLLCVPESYGDLRLANRLSDVARFSRQFRPEFIAIIGYSFGRHGDSYDDRVSLEFFQQAFRTFAGNIYVIEPNPDIVRDMLAERIKSEKVVSVRAHWNVLAHALIGKICDRNQNRSLNYVCEEILDTYGARACFPLSLDGV